MKLRSSVPLAALLLFNTVFADSTVDQAATQKRPATYADIHAQQALGRILVSSDGRILLYEWGHPYLNWVPDVTWMAPSAARRMETFVYKVDLSAAEPTSEYLFYPNAAATYWLGELSPDSRFVVVYELNHDTRSVRVGAWSFERVKMQWYSLAPDEGKLQELTAWVSNEEFVYPTKTGNAKLARASVVTGQSQPCDDCSVADIGRMQQELTKVRTQAARDASKADAKEVPANAVLRAVANNGSVSVYSRDTSDALSLLIRKSGESVRVLFENPRKETAASDIATN